MSISSAISSIRRYQIARIALSATTPTPADYDDQAVTLHSTLMVELQTSGYSSVPDALSAITVEYPPSCGDCHKCCADYWADCENWNGTTCAVHTPSECMPGISGGCWECIMRNWPEGS